MTYWPAWTDPLRHPRLLAFVHRLTHRNPETACVVCRWVWRRLEAEPAFVEGIERGRRDFEEGRTTRYEIIEGQLVPVEDAP